MVAEVTLADALDGILEAVRERLQAAAVPGGRLEEVKDVVRGDRARPQPRMPALWIVPEPAVVPNDTTPGLAESWQLPLRLAALVKDDDPDEGARAAVRLAAEARSVALGGSSRRLGLPYVNDIVSTRFDAAVRRGGQNRNLHWADATVTVRFRIREATS